MQGALGREWGEFAAGMLGFATLASPPLTKVGFQTRPYGEVGFCWDAGWSYEAGSWAFAAACPGCPQGARQVLPLSTPPPAGDKPTRYISPPHVP